MNDDYVTVGRLGRPYGIHGFLKINSSTNPFENFLNYAPWFIYFHDKKLKLIDCQLKGNFLIGKVPDCHSPEEAKKYVNSPIFVLRSQLPELEAAHYWVDLVNLDVYNLQNEFLGKVDHLMETGANDLLVIKNEEKERFIPYVLNHFIKEVDMNTKRIIVDWEKDWS